MHHVVRMSILTRKLQLQSMLQQPKRNTQAAGITELNLHLTLNVMCMKRMDRFVKLYSRPFDLWRLV
jgi:hypothetical protein